MEVQSLKDKCRSIVDNERYIKYVAVGLLNRFKSWKIDKISRGVGGATIHLIPPNGSVIQYNVTDATNAKNNNLVDIILPQRTSPIMSDIKPYGESVGKHVWGHVVYLPLTSTYTACLMLHHGLLLSMINAREYVMEVTEGNGWISLSFEKELILRKGSRLEFDRESPLKTFDS